MIDLEQLNSLLDAAGADVAEAVLEAFWSSTDGLLAEARCALPANDMRGLEAAGHALKGAALNVGAADIADAARRLELAGRSEDAAEAADALDAVETGLAPAREAFASRLAAYRIAS